MSALAVFRPHRLKRLLASDAANIRRDPTLLFVILFGALPMLLLSYFGDALSTFTRDTLGWANTYDLAVPIVLCLPPMLLGWVFGFLFLEERDDGPLMAISVTPIGVSGLMAYRLMLTGVICMGLTLIACALLLPHLSGALALFLAVLSGLQGAMITVLIPAVARNKVEGLALTKMTNLVALVPLLAWLDTPLRYLGALIPTYWIGALMLDTRAPVLAAAALIHIVLLAGLIRWANRRL